MIVNSLIELPFSPSTNNVLSLPPPSNKADFIPEPKSSSSGPFFPSNSSSDKFWRYFYDHGLANEEGILNDSVAIHPLPPLEEKQIEAIEELLQKLIIIKGAPIDFEVQMSLSEVLESCLLFAENLHLEIIEIEIVGGAVCKVLGPSYYQKAFKKLGLEDIEKEIPRDVWNEAIGQPLDYDIRIHIPSANLQQLDAFRYKIISLIADKLTFVSHLERITYVKNNAFSKFKIVNNGKNCFAITSMSNRKDLTFEFLFVKSIERDHLFFQDALRIPVISLIKNHRKFNPSTPIIPQSSLKNPWQACFDRFAKQIHAIHPHFIDSYGWPVLLSYLIRDRTCPEEDLESQLFDNILPDKELPSRIMMLLMNVLKNHHYGPGYELSAFMLQITALERLSKHLNGPEVVNIQKEMAKAELIKISNHPKEGLFYLFIDSFITHSLPWEFLIALLQLKGFIVLCEPESSLKHKKFGFDLKKHNGKSTIQFRLYSNEMSQTLLLPFELKEAISLISNTIPYLNQPQLKCVENLHASLNISLSKDISKSCLMKEHLSTLSLDLREIEKCAERWLVHKNSILQSLGFDLLLASYQLSKNKQILLTLIQNLPSFIYFSEHMESLKNRLIALEKRIATCAPCNNWYAPRTMKIDTKKKRLLRRISISIANSHDEMIARQSLTFVSYSNKYATCNYTRKVILNDLMRVYVCTHPRLAFEAFKQLGHLLTFQGKINMIEKFAYMALRFANKVEFSIVIPSLAQQFLILLKKQKNKRYPLNVHSDERGLLWIAKFLIDIKEFNTCMNLLIAFHDHHLFDKNTKTYMDLWNRFLEELNKDSMDLPKLFDLWKFLEQSGLGEVLKFEQHTSLTGHLVECFNSIDR